ncbi:hypothetical protein [Streptomyces sp. NPDC059909]|uniref:hypothetical protein n=1 Tax=Streptomyces sp. NPDC059909 TaxID=3346998 RepID=UPI003660DF8E
MAWPPCCGTSGSGPTGHWGHKEWAPERKTDPAFRPGGMAGFRARVGEILGGAPAPGPTPPPAGGQSPNFRTWGTQVRRGSAPRLPDAIRAGGAPIPADDKDVHCLTRNGTAEVTFVSALIPGCLHRTGLVPDGEDLFDHRYGSAAVADPVIPLPDGLCGSALRGPVWIYPSPGSTGSGLSVMVERSDMLDGAFHFPARAVITFNLG